MTKPDFVMRKADNIPSIVCTEPSTPNEVRRMEKKWCTSHRTPYYGTDGCKMCLLKSMVTLLSRLVDATAPYHSGPQTVQVDKAGLLDQLEPSK